MHLMQVLAADAKKNHFLLLSKPSVHNNPATEKRRGYALTGHRW